MWFHELLFKIHISSIHSLYTVLLVVLLLLCYYCFICTLEVLAQKPHGPYFTFPSILLMTKLRIGSSKAVLQSYILGSLDPVVQCTIVYLAMYHSMKIHLTGNCIIALFYLYFGNKCIHFTRTILNSPPFFWTKNNIGSSNLHFNT